MAKIVRKNQKIFGSTAGVNQIAEFGSLAAGLPVYTTDPETIQSLSNYLSGWFSGVVGSNSPAIEDMNALCYLYAYQLAYLMQTGVAEWNASTTYYIGSLVNDGAGKSYFSLIDTNLNQALTDTTKWQQAYAPYTLYVTKSADYTITDTDYVGMIGMTTGAAAKTATLPTAADNTNRVLTLKKMDSAAGAAIFDGEGGELIDNVATLSLYTQYDSATVRSTGSGWVVVNRSISPLIITVDNAAGTTGVTLTAADKSFKSFNPSGAITVKLDNSFPQGDVRTIENVGTAEITLTANDNSVIATVYQKTTYQCVSNTAAPADSTKWSGITTIQSPWIAITPTGSWVSNATYTGFYRRIGSDLLVQTKVLTTGAPTATALTLTVPLSLTIDTARLVDAVASRQIFGRVSLRDANTAHSYQGIVCYNSSTTVAIFGEDDTAPLIDRIAITSVFPWSWANNDYLSCEYKVPISTWDINKG